MIDNDVWKQHRGIGRNHHHYQWKNCLTDELGVDFVPNIICFGCCFCHFILFRFIDLFQMIYCVKYDFNVNIRDLLPSVWSDFELNNRMFTHES